jgi:Protein of unknown function (DUF2465)
MDIEAFVDDLQGKVADLDLLDLAVEITPDNCDDFGSGSHIHEVAKALVEAIPATFAAVGWPCPSVAPSCLDEKGLTDFATGLGFCWPGATAQSGTPVSLLVDYLATELQAARFALFKKKEGSAGGLHFLLSNSPSTTALAEASLDGELGLLCKLLSIPSSGDSIRSHPERALTQVKARVAKLVSALPSGALTKTVPLLDGRAATPELLATLSEINKLLAQDYALRREMLLQRVDVTVQSFLWSAKAEGREGEITAAISHKRRALSSSPAAINPADAFVAGPELTAVLSQRITDASTKALRHSSVKGVIIGAVPDRGGRVTEMKVSARDLMPEWAARKPEGGSGGGGRGGGSSGGWKGANRGAKGGAGGNREKDDRARALLNEAGKYEGEARAAAEEYDDDGGDDDRGDDHDQGGASGEGSSSGGGGNRRGRGRGGWRGGRGRGR